MANPTTRSRRPDVAATVVGILAEHLTRSEARRGMLPWDIDARVRRCADRAGVDPDRLRDATYFLAGWAKAPAERPSARPR